MSANPRRPASLPSGPDPARIFVYGSLRPGAGTSETRRLAREATHDGLAYAEGRLAAAGSYRVLAAGPGTVEGDLFLLPDPAATLPWLDAYEGLGEAGCPYERHAIAVQRPGGEPVQAWAYVAAGPRA